MLLITLLKYRAIWAPDRARQRTFFGNFDPVKRRPGERKRHQSEGTVVKSGFRGRVVGSDGKCGICFERLKEHQQLGLVVIELVSHNEIAGLGASVFGGQFLASRLFEIKPKSGLGPAPYTETLLLKWYDRAANPVAV